MKLVLGKTTIHYERKGPEGGIPIVFIHGFPFNHEMWGPQWNALPENFLGLAPDLRGFGKSTPFETPLSIEFFVDDIAALLAEHSDMPAILCGLSMGGYISMRFAERHPEKVRGLILADTKSESDSNEGKVKRSETIRVIRSKGVAAFADQFLRSVFAPASFETRKAEVAMIRRVIMNTPEETLTAALLALAARTDTTPMLSALTVPALVVCGEEDILTPPQNAKDIHSRITGSELVLLNGGAHMSNLENSEGFNKAFLSFLGKFQQE